MRHEPRAPLFLASLIAAGMGDAALPWKRQRGLAGLFGETLGGGCWGVPPHAPCLHPASLLRRLALFRAVGMAGGCVVGPPSDKGCWGPSLGSLAPVGGGHWGGFRWEVQVTAAVGWAPPHATAMCLRHAGTPLMFRADVRLISPQYLRGNRASLGGQPGARRWLYKPHLCKGTRDPREMLDCRLAGDGVCLPMACRAAGHLLRAPCPRWVRERASKVLSSYISQLGKPTLWGFFPSVFFPPNRSLCVSAGSLAAMEEGGDGPVGEKSPSERDGATSDHEGSAEHDASSPPGSEGESHRDGWGLTMMSPRYGDRLCHWSNLPGTPASRASSSLLLVHGVN